MMPPESRFGADDRAAPAASLSPAPQKFKYRAFISYSHQDIEVAKAVQEFLEDYELPTAGGAPAARIAIYRDATDIRTGHLGDQLHHALSGSVYLVVCVSKAALQSHWVKQEVDAFKAARPDAIIPLLLDGEPSDVAALLGFESRYADLTAHRTGARRFKTREQLELVRVLAKLADRDVRTLVPWHTQRRKLRLTTVIAGSLTVVLLLMASGAGYLFQRQAAREANMTAQREGQQRATEAARRQGDGALASMNTNLFAQAAVGLARLDPSAASLGNGQYAQARHFLLPRLMTFTEAASSLGRGQTARWGGSNLIRGPDGLLREMRGAALEGVWFSPMGTELIAVDVAHRVSRVAWPAMTVRGPYALDAVRVTSVAWAPDGRPSLIATAIMLLSDEDTEDAQVDGETVRIDLDADARPLPPVTLSADAASAAVARAPAAGHPSSRLVYPRLRDERTFWRTATARLPDKQSAALPMAVREAPPFGVLDLSALKDLDATQRESLARSMDPDVLESGMAVVDGRHIALASTVTGNQSVATIACGFDPATRIATWCHVEETTATVRRTFSPDYRFALFSMSEVQDDAFRLLDLSAGGARCKIGVHPAERAMYAAFEPTGSRLAVRTRDGEMWVYDVNKKPCEAKLSARFALPDVSSGVVAFAGPDTLIWLMKGSSVHAVDAASGLTKWSHKIAAPQRMDGSGILSVSPDRRLFATVIDGTITLRSALTGVGLSGDFAVFHDAARDDLDRTICQVTVNDLGVVRVEFGRELSCSADTAPPAQAGRGAWVRLAPDDPALGFAPVTPLWRRTGISDEDGTSPVPLGKLLAPANSGQATKANPAR